MSLDFCVAALLNYLFVTIQYVVFLETLIMFYVTLYIYIHITEGNEVHLYNGGTVNSIKFECCRRICLTNISTGSMPIFT